MKKLLNLVLIAAIFNSLAAAAKAQDSTCFMLDSNGNPINLGSLCQSTPPKTQPNNFKRDRQYSQPSYSQPQPKRSGVYVVPIKSRISGIPVIEVTFNDRHVFEMMLDTGASQTTITRQMAKTLKVPHQVTFLVSTPSDDRVPMSGGYVRSMEVANIFQKNHLVITSPNMDIGLLGQSFFGRYDITIGRDTIEFRER